MLFLLPQLPRGLVQGLVQELEIYKEWAASQSMPMSKKDPLEGRGIMHQGIAICVDHGITIRIKLGRRTRKHDSVNIRSDLLLCIFAFSRNRKWTSTYPLVHKRIANNRRLLRHLWKRWNVKLDRQPCPGTHHF
jgi:hypothetical protein